MLRLSTLAQPLDCLKDDFQTDKPILCQHISSRKGVNHFSHQENSVSKARQAFNFPKAIREALARRPFAGDCGK